MLKTKVLYSVALVTFLVFFAGMCKKDESNPPTACFDFSSVSIDGGNLATVDEVIEFDNCSENADSYLWDFGDGSTSTSENPEHSYDEAGTYVVTLEATNGDGTKEISHNIEIQATLTGTWEGELDLDSEIFPFIFEIEQDGSELNGNFQFDDGSGFATFSSISEIIDQEVTINFTVAGYAMEFTFTGEVNDSFDAMDGSYTISVGGSSATGTWFADKVGTKSTNGVSKGKGLEFLLEQLK
jgi:PKD repeat protein